MVYIINRMYFAVPEWVPKTEFKPFGGFSWPRVEMDRVNILYPLKVSEARVFTIERPNFYSYTGPAYQGLAEFDYFAEKYGRRLLK